VITNTLPVFNTNKECFFCKKHVSNGWHILLECNKAKKKRERKMLESLGYDNRQAKKIIKKRKKMTKIPKNKFKTSITWTNNWAIWKTYTDVSHSEQKKSILKMIRKFMFKEEFRILYMLKKSISKTDASTANSINDTTYFYDLNLQHENNQIKYKQHLQRV